MEVLFNEHLAVEGVLGCTVWFGVSYHLVNTLMCPVFQYSIAILL